MAGTGLVSCQDAASDDAVRRMAAQARGFFWAERSGMTVRTGDDVNSARVMVGYSYTSAILGWRGGGAGGGVCVYSRGSKVGGLR